MCSSHALRGADFFTTFGRRSREKLFLFAIKNASSVNFVLCPASRRLSFLTGQSNRGHFSVGKFTSLPESKRQIAWLQMEQVVAGAASALDSSESIGCVHSPPFFSLSSSFLLTPLLIFLYLLAPEDNHVWILFINLLATRPIEDTAIYIEFANNTQRTREL